MTEDHTPDTGLDEVERRDYAALVDFFASTLDVCGGLVEAVDVAHYATMSSHIASLLDLEAGLQSALTADAVNKKLGPVLQQDSESAMTTHAGRELFAFRWAEAVVGTSYVSMGRELVEAALATEFDPLVGSRIGAELVAAHFTGAETLSKTLALMAEELPGLVGSALPGVDVAGRVGQLIGSLAAGYAGALRERSLAELHLEDLTYHNPLKAASLERDAAHKHTEIIAAISQEKSALEENIDKLREFEREYRARLKTYLESQLRELTGRGSAAPADTARAQQDPPGTVLTEYERDTG